MYPQLLVAEEAEIAAAGLGDPRVTTASAHCIRTYPAQLCGRPAQYFTILREPLDHFRSYVRYMMTHRETYRVPRRLKTQRDVAQWFLDARFGEIGSENMQTNHLALGPWCHAHGRDLASYPLWSAEDHHAYWDARLDVAKSTLRSFLSVGVVEKLPESLELLRARAASVGIALLSSAAVPWVNASEPGDGDDGWLDPGTPIGEAIEKALVDDLKLYAYAARLFDRDYRALVATGARGSGRSSASAAE